MQLPENGFYYHYKHDPSKGFNDHAYEVVDLALHSEAEEYCVVYRPLYDKSYMGPANVMVRPLKMFMEDVIVDGQTRPRFTRITDSDVIAKIEDIKTQMYAR